MTVLLLLIAALIAACSVIWLVTYASIIKSIMGRTYSPRLTWCKFLIPLDIVVTSVLILGPMLTGIHGIQGAIFGVFVGAGLSVGVAFTRRVMMPRWRARYEALKSEGFQVA